MTIAGDITWTDYTVSAKAMIGAKSPLPPGPPPAPPTPAPLFSAVVAKVSSWVVPLPPLPSGPAKLNAPHGFVTPSLVLSSGCPCSAMAVHSKKGTV